MSPILLKGEGGPRELLANLNPWNGERRSASFLGAISVHMGDKKVIMNGQHGLTAAK